MTTIQQRLLACCVLIVCIAGCATAPPLQTRSGRPEITVHNATTARVRAAVINHFVDRGWSPVNTNDNELLFEHEGSMGEAFVMGLMTDNPQSKDRITVTLVENGSDIRVIGGVAAIGANNFGRAQIVELSGKGYQQLQAALQQIKGQLE